MKDCLAPVLNETLLEEGVARLTDGALLGCVNVAVALLSPAIVTEQGFP